MRNYANHPNRFMVLKYSCHGTVRSWGGLLGGSLRTSKYMCNTCKACDCNAEGYTVGKMDKGRYLDYDGVMKY